MRRWIAIAAAVLVVADLALLISGRRVLIYERKVNPGEHYIAGEWGDLGKAGQAQLACRYWTGRSVTLNVLWFSPGNFMGRDQCPFIVDSDS